ncbi:MAG: LysM peptidoglycan-binding domain-containing protein [Planctomycetaceae bacterium]|nr:LysM peptidoglycan-binding domain-containing protein [Planctomycetaceae bacterium]
MKIVKRIAVALVLCLAVVGAFALLKKAPQLNVPPEDIHYLKEVGISASESATDEGLSGAHGSVQGVPSLVSPSQIQGSNTPPGSFGVSSPLSASVPLLPTAGSETPALTAKTEAPPFTISSEAPPFAANSEAPPFVAANPEPVTAAPFVVPTLPQAAPTPSVPLQPVPTQTPIPPPVQPPPPDKPVTWDGPITEVVFIPSTDVSDPWRVSGVIERPTEPSELLPKPVDPFLAFAVSAPVPSPPSTDSTNSTQSLVHAGQETALPNNNSNDNNNFQVNKNKVAVSGDRIKRLPTVAEKTPEMKQMVTAPIDFEKNTPLFSAAIPVSVPIDSQKRLYSQTSPLPEEKYPPFKLNDYRQTSIRSDIAFVPVLPSVKEEQPMISFVQQKPEKFAVKETIPLATILPAKLETEIPFTDTKPIVPETVTEAVSETKAIDSIPFVAIESSPVAPTIEIPAQQTAPMIRETVGRFIKAQTVLIESGEAAKIRNAFVQLSRLYEHQELNEAEKAYMLPLLDRLALNVIYSRNAHILEPAYIIRLGDSVDSIAQTFDLSPALLMKINGLTGARPLEPGTELKVVVGHFDAKISAGHRELTLILGGLYAGRFPVALGERIEHLRGEFYVSSKTDAWNEKSLTLNNGVVFYGTDRPQPGDPLATTVRFTQQDAKELLDILTEHSVIVFED